MSAAFEPNFIDNVLSQIVNTTTSEQLVFDDLKNELLKKDEITGKSLYNVSIKEDDNVAMIFYNNQTNTLHECYCRSHILDKETLKPVASQYNKIIYND